MKRTTLNYIIDFIGLINLLCLAVTGFIIKYILPPGTGGGHGYGYRGGRGPAEEIKDLWSLTRHQWGDIHFYFSVAFITLILLHIILHWTWIKNCSKSIFLPKKSCTES